VNINLYNNNVNSIEKHNWVEMSLFKTGEVTLVLETNYFFKTRVFNTKAGSYLHTYTGFPCTVNF